MKNLLLCVSMALALTACARTNAPTTTLEESLNSYKSGSCGVFVINDYNDVVNKCKTMKTKEDGKKCKTKIEAFQTKYPDINCTAKSTSGSAAEEETVTVTPDTFQTVLYILTAGEKRKH